MSEQGDASLELQPTVTTGTGFADALSQVLESDDSAAVASAVASGVDRFTTLRKVGEGGMGVVYEADDSQFGRRVALKRLTGGATLQRRFIAESVVTANLEHPGIAPVYERGLGTDGTPFYAMRFVRGRTLGEAVAESNTLEERLKLLPSVVRVAHTLGFAHEHGVVHRDVKPDNIVIGRHGETVLLDWGIAKVRGVPSTSDLSGEGPLEGHAGATRHGAIIGTPAYMAPEQAAGDVGRIDERTDVFALGALLYHLLTGRPPFEADPAADPLAKARKAQAPPIRKLAPKAPVELCAIAERAMSRAPEQRYQKASGLADALEAYVGNRLAGAESRLILVLANLAGLAALALLAIASIMVVVTMPTMHELGIASYIFTGFALCGMSLAAIEWRTRGRYRLTSLAVGLAVCTVLLGVASTFAGFERVLGLAVGFQVAGSPEKAFEILLVGAREAFGNLAPSATLGAILAMVLALVARANGRWRERREAAAAGS